MCRPVGHAFLPVAVDALRPEHQNLPESPFAVSSAHRRAPQCGITIVRPPPESGGSSMRLTLRVVATLALMLSGSSLAAQGGSGQWIEFTSREDRFTGN